MKKTMSGALVLPTALALVLVGTVAAAAPASAEPAQVVAAASPSAEPTAQPSAEPTAQPSEGGAAPTPVPAPVPAPAPVSVLASVPDEVASPPAGEPAEPEPEPEPVAEPVAEPDAETDGDADADADAVPALQLTSPVQGAVYQGLGYVVSFPTDLVDYQVEILDAAGEVVVGTAFRDDPVFTRNVGLSDAAPADQTTTVVLYDSAGTELGRQTVSFSIVAETSPEPVLTSPATGEAVVGRPSSFGSQAYAVRLDGRGVPGSQVAVTFDALSGQEGWGSDDQPFRVAADGRWAWDTVLPAGEWGIRLSQYVPGGTRDEEFDVGAYPLTRSSATVSSTFRVVAPASATGPDVGPTTAPAAVAPVAAVVERTAASVGPRTRSLAHTGVEGSTSGAGVAGLGLVAAGLVALGLARLQRRRAVSDAGGGSARPASRA